MGLNLDVRWKLSGGESAEFEPELFALLQEIEASGSLLAAAKTLGVSYRYAWELMRTWSRRIGHPLAELQRGRGAKLTSLGVKLLWGQRRINARLGPTLESLASELDTEIGAVVRGHEAAPLRALASHGLAVAMLRDLVNATGLCHLDLQFRGSLDCLRMLRAGKCDIAGFHVPEGALGTRLAPRYRRLIDVESDAFVHVVRREQGIMLASGNPKKIRAVPDLAQAGVRFVNRQPRSGTRLIFDALLEEAGIEAADVRGYHNEEFTHMAVAAMIASGAADAGFGIKAAAAQLGLAFIPVVSENYLFAMTRQTLAARPAQAIREVLRGRDFRRRIAALPGYDVSRADTVLTANEVFASRD
ncbi:MAG: substrate-binding domain-containing protein [Chromatiales bacterium]